ncbi:hypothetical protein D9615_004931 [Tricholomella constricta]|uniref:R3H domain-containing protein n=1 Tax=Tricholomella constricta TaxID=117010 RepID=A0A8H5M768_9AGAR|nr:hypothetical protein D9615_004931 [Tricholomella constricta]
MVIIVACAPRLVASRENFVSRHTIPAITLVMLHRAAQKTNRAQLSSPSPAHAGAFAAPKCNNECAVAKRNARLADALGITAESREKTALVTYHDEVAGFARASSKFLVVVEKAFDEFVTSQKKTQVLPHMPPERRKFVHDLAAVYRMDTQMVDQEPHRSVLLLRRLDTRIPTPLLSSTIAASTPTPSNLGKLADLRIAAAPSWRASPTPSVLKQNTVGWGTSRPTSAAATTHPQPQPSLQSTRPPAGANATRASSPAPVRAPLAPSLSAVEPPATPTAVPENWEDDL